MAEKKYDSSKDMITGDKLMLFVQTEAAGEGGTPAAFVVRHRDQYRHDRHQQQNVGELERVSCRSARIHGVERISPLAQDGPLLVQHIEAVDERTYAYPVRHRKDRRIRRRFSAGR